LSTNSEKFDEEGLLKVIRTCELSEQIAKFVWNWDNYSDPIKVAHELLNKHQKLFIEISEYMQGMESNLSKYQRNQITNAMEDLGKLIPYMKNKIKSPESLEKIVT